jgi:uncharacterized protein (UPF0264 family)
MKRKGFKMSPTIHLPKASVTKMQVAAAAAAAAAEVVILQNALRDAVRLIDRLQRNEAGWTHAEVKRIEEIRLLSLGI